MNKDTKSILLIVLLLCISIIALMLNKNDSTKENNNNSNEEYKEKEVDKNIEINFSTDKIEVSDESLQSTLFNKLLDLKDTIGDDYLDFNKNNDIYFISLKDLNEKYNIDISEFKDENNNICDINNSGIYFDNNQTLFDHGDNDNILVPILIGCFIDNTNN